MRPSAIYANPVLLDLIDRELKQDFNGVRHHLRNGALQPVHALSFVSAALSLTEVVSNRDVLDDAKFKEGLGKVIDGVVQCLNASAWAK